MPGVGAVKSRGGYSVLLEGRPEGEIEVLPEPEVLYLPLWSRRFSFSEVSVEEGERVHSGQVMAKDPQNYSVPLLAPRSATVRLNQSENHIALEDVTRITEEQYHPAEELVHIPRGIGSAGMKRYKLLMLGAWQFLQDAHTGDLPDPFGTPRAVIVSTVQLEPFLARGDVQIRKRLQALSRGLEQLQSLLEYQPIYLVMPDIESELASWLREMLRGYAWLQLVLIPRRYGLDNFAVLARHLGLKQNAQQPVWAVGVAGILAMDRALTVSRPCEVRIVSIGGPQVGSPVHLKAMPGYPLEKILESRLSPGPVRVLNGGVMTGQEMDSRQRGLDVECVGLTVLPELSERHFIRFVRAGWDHRSYSNCFLSLLRGAFPEGFTTGLQGELRACISCGFCEEVCPARIMPHLIHKHLYQGELEEAEKIGLQLCVRCGLCSFVCPSKIELREQLVEAQETLRTELQGEDPVGRSVSNGEEARE
jgi:Na+-transporting NADH:ubiquinone oxidoreductase subunit A